MASGKFATVWLKLLDGKPQHAGLGIAAIGFLVAAIGFAIAFFASGSPERSRAYWLGFAIVVVGVLSGCCGIIYDRILSIRTTRRRREDS